VRGTVDGIARSCENGSEPGTTMTVRYKIIMKQSYNENASQLIALGEVLLVSPSATLEALIVQ
jgi:hypothetical protein